MIETTHTVTIDDCTYDIRLLDAITGFRVYTKLLSAVGGALEGAGKLDGSKPAELGLKVVGAAFKNLSPELAEELRATFAKSCALHAPDGKKPELSAVFLQHFRGRYLHMSKWLLECIKVNFSDFLAEDSGVLEGLISRIQSKSPSTSTGSSSES